MTKNSLIIIVLAGLAFFTCKKKEAIRFEEDPESTHMSPQQRLLGSWNLAQYTFNGQDIAPQLNAIFANRFDVKTLSFASVYYDDTKEYSYSIGSANVKFAALDQMFDGTHITFIQNGFSGPVVSDTVFRKWLITPFHYNSQAQQRWRVTKLFENSWNIALATDTGEFKIFFEKK